MASQFQDLIARDNPVVEACSRTGVKGKRPAEPLNDTLLWEIPDSLAGWERAQDRSDAGCSA
ncbi:hypothetical protein BMS3Bbin01_00114 [bacterium BMS3Bbin01]|nr:hypothetical protein BMS3Bbin01_00114 [bacterium BMS3Bbin01]